MTFGEAEKIAYDYVSNMGEVASGLRYTVGTMTEFVDRYYFDFILRATDGFKLMTRQAYGGARGFTVHKNDGAVQVTSYYGYNQLVHQEEELNKTYQLCIDFKNRNKNLVDIKTKFGLTSIELVQLSKLINTVGFSKGDVFVVLGHMIRKV